MKIVTWSLPRPWLLQTYVSRLGRNQSQYLSSRVCRPIHNVESSVYIKEISYPSLTVLLDSLNCSDGQKQLKWWFYTDG